MKTETEIRAKLRELRDNLEALAWWEDGKEQLPAAIAALRWALGEEEEL